MALLDGRWQWALRLTPALGLTCIILFSRFHRDPPRGRAEGGENLRTASWLEDIRYLAFSSPTFLFVSAAFTCVSSVLGAVS
ncbi:unnamed protein product [Protopolystoma xenopodis]|uniref:Major facilitator superfamily (MFS) profile domain-containing protein n=1 Tax=Protopolystoma xenopodis TaxID=117903 RepID=A0A448XRE0_9PLAT|nr:unnamed protein product [Protopolystoma xenopodis]